MAYRAIGNPDPAHLDNIELNTRYDAGSYNYAPPPGTPPDRDKKRDVDTKGLLSQSSQPPVNSWPVHSRRAAAMTPMRFSLLVFDVVLASTPIMFLGQLLGSRIQDDAPHI